jgi:hypothetical protein
MPSVTIRCKIPTLREILEEEVRLARNSSNQKVREIGELMDLDDESLNLEVTYRLIKEAYIKELENDAEGLGILDEAKLQDVYSDVLEAEKRLWKVDSIDFKVEIIPAEKYELVVKKMAKVLGKTFGKNIEVNTRRVLCMPHIKKIIIPDQRIIKKGEGVIYKNWDYRSLKGVMAEEIDHILFNEAKGKTEFKGDITVYNRQVCYAEALAQCNLMELAKEDKELSDYVLQSRLNYWPKSDLNALYCVFFSVYKNNPDVLALPDSANFGKSEEDSVIFGFDAKSKTYKERMKKFKTKINKFYPVSG